MQTIDGRPVYAATDLVGYPRLRAPDPARARGAGRASSSDRCATTRSSTSSASAASSTRSATWPTSQAEGRTRRRDRARRLDRGPGRPACAPRPPRRSRRWPRGDDVIYQATFFDGTWRGHADFLLRVDDPTAHRSGVRGTTRSPTPSWRATSRRAPSSRSARTSTCSTDPGRPARVDARRARRQRPGGRAPARRRLHGLLPRARRRASWRPWPTRPRPTYPPAGHATRSRSSTATSAAGPPECAARRRADDHLSLVAGITAGSAARCTARGVTDARGARRARPADDAAARGHRAAALERVREQARIQLEGRRDGPAAATSCSCPTPGEPIDPERGLATLPPPSPGDLFFDIEGDPYALDDGLDYLFGVLERRTATFHAVLVARRRPASSPSTASGAPSSGSWTSSASGSRATRTCTSTTTRRTSRPRSSA